MNPGTIVRIGAVLVSLLAVYTIFLIAHENDATLIQVILLACISLFFLFDMCREEIRLIKKRSKGE